MRSLATTVAATAFAGLSLAAPTAQTSPAVFYIQATSVYTDGKYDNFPLNACHTAAGVEAFCAIDKHDGGLFSLNNTAAANGPADLIYYLSVDAGTSGVEQDPQRLSFLQNSSYPTLEYGFFGTDGDSKQFVADETNFLGIYQAGSEPLTTFYLCPEYVDYNHEGYPTISLIGEYQAVPSDSGCDTVSLKRIFT